VKKGPCEGTKWARQRQVRQDRADQHPRPLTKMRGRACTDPKDGFWRGALQSAGTATALSILDRCGG
jgi:hypothetical protein